jgi:hypothetical protein
LVTAIDIIELDNRSFHIFPNPANDFIQIESNVHTVGRITDVTGRILTENFIIQANQIGCHIITVGNDFLKKLKYLNYNLEKFSLETVKDFYKDAKESKYSIN